MRVFEKRQFWLIRKCLFTDLRKNFYELSLKGEKFSNHQKGFKNHYFLNISPLTAGLGIGLDRLLTILLNQRSIQDIIYFPFVRRKE